MVTTKNLARSSVVILLAGALLAGCSPPGPRALFQGKKLLENGQYAQAVEKLKTAVLLLGNTNAQALNYLGVAYHQAEAPAEAARAYQRALYFDPDLSEVHFNLGCLWLEQNRVDQAKAELTAFTLRRSNAVEGWLKLGATQWRAREFTAAERSFTTALKLSPGNAEALNGLGLVLVKHQRPAEAAQYFRQALKEQPDYRPALLNLAIVSQEALNDRALAVEQYRQYIALKPTPENAEAVRALIRELEQRPSWLSLHSSASGAASTKTNFTAPAKSPPASPRPAVTNATERIFMAKADVHGEEHHTSPAQGAPKPMARTLETNAIVQVETIPAEPVLKAAQDSPSPSLGSQGSLAKPLSAPRTDTRAEEPSKSSKRGFFRRLNPLTLFAAQDKTATPTALPQSARSEPPVEQAAANAERAAGASDASVALSARYSYKSPLKPDSGDRSEAELLFGQGVKAQQAEQLPQAIEAYQRSVKADPAFYDSWYNLGLVAAQAANTSLALTAYEEALAIRPESLDARYNFALLLKQANFIRDAADEMEKILARFPNESRTHLALGNLYAQQLHDPVRARAQYLAVLKVDPQNPQAPAIRYWLTGSGQ